MTIMKDNDFMVFILTHGRPDRVYTLKTLRKRGYTGPVKLIVDNEDKTIDEYRKRFGDEVIVFDKKAMADQTDEGDNFDDRRVILHARNVCFDVARELGVRYFLELDDDYMTFSYKFDAEGNYKERNIKNLDAIFAAVLKFYKRIPALSVALAQNGDFIGGAKGSFGRDIKLRRKCMNTFFCDTERRFYFKGRINEDVNVYTSEAIRGGLFFTIPTLSINQKQTQSNKSGMTDVYLDGGTYIKSFYSVMFAPSAVKVAMMGDKNMRLHHQVKWRNTTPMILSEDYKK